ncbi:MAG TPA: sorbosone dehydrogenase [Hydrogenophaga sp.]|uniref:PQQ-dependent sugar dehydrogenase n=1 Tax=Hydrogenophaga sp. TaxID=1904254 RepID=UPI0008BD28E0|nr:sorbosone dehydrogenase family protein [Hydrogenophaga sp.]MBU4182387.1 sorbosone dehydrogenase family protein [Gammaproteobacteria bacterium]OGA75239.1 MAG: sorbosone dehydrogenase [Burkholderiales bacterium GWE1_65_30]OGA93372.1 MAG: sorbosone dehydrogenase [Burkholderiales bacterium GWF1_66_17]MBU4278916.1 sorbosone dehydrogenase family protein [Gammaproteobacteria bacterium]MBU4325608.1 sorbosone dehydrogenase family protein [Gammaproteobacteria bacterium]
MTYTTSTARAAWAATGTAALLALGGCAEPARFTVAEGSGNNPALPTPSRALIPTVNIAPARGWPDGAMPTPAPGLRVQAYARDLDHPRWLLVLPNGDVLVAETNAPPKAEAPKGITAWIKGKVMGLVMKRAGAAVPSANRITLLRDTDGDGEADVRSVLLDGLYSPFGMALVGERLFVANADAVLAFPYRRGDTTISAAGIQLVALPGGPINHHWTKSLIASPDGQRLYVGVGSNSNIGENGMAAEEGRAAVWEVDARTGAHRVFASGLRNPVGLAWDASGRTLWAVVNERDELGSDLVPDYLTSVRDGAFYGWPYSYYGQRVDTRVKPPAPDQVAKAVVPDFALGAHVAPLGLASAAGSRLPAPFTNGMFIGQHGSWNRRPHSGYKVVFVPFSGGQPSGPARDMLSGFLNASGEAQGRPVGVAMDGQGALLVADDVGNVVWRVSASP